MLLKPFWAFLDTFIFFPYDPPPILSHIELKIFLVECLGWLGGGAQNDFKSILVKWLKHMENDPAWPD